jgi:hypothetical protein
MGGVCELQPVFFDISLHLQPPALWLYHRLNDLRYIFNMNVYSHQPLNVFTAFARADEQYRIRIRSQGEPPILHARQKTFSLETPIIIRNGYS